VQKAELENGVALAKSLVPEAKALIEAVVNLPPETKYEQAKPHLARLERFGSKAGELPTTILREYIERDVWLLEHGMHRLQDSHQRDVESRSSSWSGEGCWSRPRPLRCG